MALKINTKQFELLFGEAKLIDTRFPEKISAGEPASPPLNPAPGAADTAYCLRVGAEMPVAAMWTWNHGAWSECGTLTPPEILEKMGHGRRVYVRLDERTPATLILSCKAISRRSAYRIVAEPARAGLLPPDGGIITDEHAGIYNRSTGEWTNPQLMAQGAAVPYLGTRLTAYRCKSDLYELELADCADVYLPGRLKPARSKFAHIDLPAETFRALKTFDLLPLRPLITRPLPPLPTMNTTYNLIGLVPLNDSVTPTARAKNMKLYHILHWVSKNDMRSTHASCFYYISPVSGIAPHGAIIFLGREDSGGEQPTQELLARLQRRLMEEDLTTAVYLFSHHQGRVTQKEGLPITAPCQPCSENPLELLDTLPTRELYTYHTPWFARSHLNQLAEAPYEHLCFSLREYEGTFSPGEPI